MNQLEFLPLQMLDVKLANYSPFVELMAAAGGGMFVTASDDIEAMEIDRYQIERNTVCVRCNLIL